MAANNDSNTALFSASKEKHFVDLNITVIDRTIAANNDDNTLLFSTSKEKHFRTKQA